MYDITKADSLSKRNRLRGRIKAMMRETRGYINGLRIPRELVSDELEKAYCEMRELEQKLAAVRTMDQEEDFE